MALMTPCDKDAILQAMELRHLAAFLAVAEELHFGRAAERRGIAQPALSLMIKALEASLGVRLFERNRRHVALTPAGQAFLPEAKATLAQAERARRAALRAWRGEAGHLEVAFTGSTPFGTVMPRIIGRFRRTWPDIALSLRELSTSAQMEEIRQGSLDIAFLRPDRGAEPAWMTLHPILDEPLLAVLAADHPLAGRPLLSVADLAEDGFILSPHHAGTGLYERVTGLCRDAGFVPRLVMEAHQMATVVGLAAAGIGVSIVPETMRRFAVEGVRFIALAEADAHMALMLGHRHDDERLIVRRFVETALAAAGRPAPPG